MKSEAACSQLSSFHKIEESKVSSAVEFTALDLKINIFIDSSTLSLEKDFSPIMNFSTVIKFIVRVPVLSVQIVVALPIVSHAHSSDKTVISHHLSH